MSAYLKNVGRSETKGRQLASGLYISWSCFLDYWARYDKQQVQNRKYGGLQGMGLRRQWQHAHGEVGHLPKMDQKISENKRLQGSSAILN